MVWRLASSAPHREAGDGLEVAPTGLEGLLDEAVTSPSEAWCRPLPQELRALIRRMAAENWLWGQKRIQAELARLGFKVSARTVAKYMRGYRNRGPSPGWRKFLKQHAPNIWACDFFCVHTILFETLYVFFVVRLANRQVLHVEVTRLCHEF